MRRLGKYARQSRVLFDIGTTVASNLVITALGGAGGILIARALGPEARGEYAVLAAWFGIAVVVAEYGQPAAICYFISRDPPQASAIVKLSRAFLLRTGIGAACVGAAMAVPLANSSGVSAKFFLAIFAIVPFTAVNFAYTFALQPLSIDKWNLARTVAPAAYLAGVTALYTTGQLRVSTVIAALGCSFMAQALCVRRLLRSQFKQMPFTTEGPPLDLAGSLHRYGQLQMLANAPALLTTKLDQILLAALLSTQSVGYYAVGASFALLIPPVIVGLGYVAFPRIARQSDEGSRLYLARKFAIASAGIAALCAAGIWVIMPFLVNSLAGEVYAPAIPIGRILALSVAANSLAQVAGDLLRGLQRPGVVAAAQWFGVAVLVGLVWGFRSFGARGVAYASLTANAATAVAVLAGLYRSHRSFDQVRQDY